MSNEVKVTLDAKQASEDIKDAATVLASAGPPLWRLQLIRILQTVGIIIGLLGLADTQKMIEALNPEWAAWLALSGAALRFGVEPLVMLIGDFADDGKLNKSFKIDQVGLFLLVCFVIPCLSSCEGLQVVTHSPYGSGSYQDGVATYTPPAIPIRVPIHYAK